MPEAGLVAGLDPALFAAALGRLAGGLLRRPSAVVAAMNRYAAGLTAAWVATMARAAGSQVGWVVRPDARDRRFSDPTWQENPWYFWVQQRYLLGVRMLDDLTERADVDDGTRRKARFALALVADALAPTNFPWGNPAVLKRAFETGGLSLVRGFRNFALDALTNRGRPRQVDASAYRFGENLAATPGKVVFRNALVELIQYAPQTRTVYEVPLLFSPPWINRYYVLDLAPGRSLIEWAVRQGHTAFALSYRNPDASMRDVGLEDYLISGPRAALGVIEDVTGSPVVNGVGLCLGGTLTAMLVAYLAAANEPGVGSLTLLNSLLDFSDPGLVGAFCDPESVEILERKMGARGYLDAAEMADTFNLIRANELIWSYAVSNWLMGEDPPAFDLLVWANDNTRMPARMHSFYLRACYLENRFARGELELAGESLSLSSITQDAYVLGALEDHIVPWEAAYRSTQLLKGDASFVLASSGHVASIVRPPGSRARYWTADGLPASADAWLQAAKEHEGSWWEHWGAWLAGRAGGRRRPPALGSSAHPPIADAPGLYVLER